MLEISLSPVDRAPSFLVSAGVLFGRSSGEFPVSISQAGEAVDQSALDRFQGSRRRRRGDHVGSLTVSCGEVAGRRRLSGGTARVTQLLERRGTVPRELLELRAHGALVGGGLRRGRSHNRLRGSRVVARRPPEEQPADGSRDDQSRGDGDPRERSAARLDRGQ